MRSLSIGTVIVLAASTGAVLHGADVRQLSAQDVMYGCATDINKHGVIAGFRGTGGLRVGISVWNRGTAKHTGIETELGNEWLPPVINDHGELLIGGGLLPAEPGPATRSYLWKGGDMTLISAGGKPTMARALNDSGQIAGWMEVTPGVEHAFRYENGVFEDLSPGIVNFNYTRVLGMSSKGDVLFNAYATGMEGSFLWREEGLTELPFAAVAMNDRLQIIGEPRGCFGTPDRCAVYLWEDGIVAELAAGLKPRSLSERGAIVAYQIVSTPSGNFEPTSFVLEDGGLVNLGFLDGAELTAAIAINKRGQIVGASGIFDLVTGEEHTRAFLWEDGSMIELPSLGGMVSVAWDINDHGQIVGCSQNAQGKTHAVLWENEQIIDLETWTADE